MLVSVKNAGPATSSAIGCTASASLVKWQAARRCPSGSCGVLIIGGGGMGASSAFWLKSRALQLGRKLNVLVVERDAGVSTRWPKIRHRVIQKVSTISYNFCRNTFNFKV